VVRVRVHHVNDWHTFELAPGSTIADLGNLLRGATGIFDNSYRMLNLEGHLLSRTLRLPNHMVLTSMVLENLHSHLTLKWEMNGERIGGIDVCEVDADADDADADDADADDADADDATTDAAADANRMAEIRRRLDNNTIMVTLYNDFVAWDALHPGVTFPFARFMSAADMNTGRHAIGFDVELRADPFGTWHSMRDDDGNRFIFEPDVIIFGVCFLDTTATPPEWVHTTFEGLLFDVFGAISTDDPCYREEDDFVEVVLAVDIATGVLRLTARLTHADHVGTPPHVDEIRLGCIDSPLRWYVECQGDVVVTPSSSSWSGRCE
jgi:hypothetical protein